MTFRSLFPELCGDRYVMDQIASKSAKALMCALVLNQKERVDTLRANNIWLGDFARDICLHHIVRKPDIDAMRLFLNTFDCSHHTTQILHQVVSREAYAIVTMLVREYGVDVDARCEIQGRTPLLCCGNANRAMAELLISLGADVNATDIHGRGLISKSLDFDILAFFVDLGLDIDQSRRYAPHLQAVVELANFPKALELVALGARCRNTLSRHSATRRVVYCGLLLPSTKSPKTFTTDRRLQKCAALMHLVNIPYCGAKFNAESMAEVKLDLARARLSLVREACTELCIGLRSLRLPLLLVVDIMDKSTHRLMQLIPYHLKWRFAAMANRRVK